MNAKNKPKKKTPPPRLDRWYPGDPPRPVPWWCWKNAPVVEAVECYLGLVGDAKGERKPLDRAGARWLLAYLQYAIEAPCWTCPADVLACLRRRAYHLGDSRQVGDWLQDCLAEGIDILGNP